jgi:sugar lactone lactonase YvrE
VPDGRTFPAGLATGVLTLALGLGPNTVRLTFDDGAGPTELAFTVFRLAEAPGVRIVTPSDGTFTNQLHSVVTGTAPLGTPLVQVNGVTATFAADGIHFAADVPLAEGANELTAVEFTSGAVDRVAVTRDTVAPAFVEALPPNGASMPVAEVRFEGQLSERGQVTAANFGGVVTAPTASEPSGNAIGSPGGAYGFVLPPLALIGGTNAIGLQARDRAGNVTLLSRTVEVRDLALRLVAPAAGASVPALRTDLALEATEAVTLDAVYAGGRRFPAFEGRALPTGTSSLSAIALAPGENEVRIVYRRGAGSPEVLSFVLTSTASDGMPVAGTVTDAATGAPIPDALVQLTINGITSIVVADASGGYAAVAEPGNVIVVATSSGYADGSGSATGGPGESVFVEIGLEASGIPSLASELSILVPPAGTVTDFAALTVVGAVTDPSASVVVNGIPAEVVGHRFQARPVPLASGSNTIEVTASRVGRPTVTRSVEVERSDTPVLAVTTFSPPRGARVPGGGLVVRGFVSAREALVSLDDSVPTAGNDGIFTFVGVDLAEGDHTLVAGASLPGGDVGAATASLPLHVSASTPALVLRAVPGSSEVPLESRLSLAFGSAPFPIARIDFDHDGDGALDVPDSASHEIDVTMTQPRIVTARGYATTPDGVELSALARLAAHAPPVVLQEMAQGNPVDLARGPSGDVYVLDGAAAEISRYTPDGTLVQRFGGSGTGTGQMLAPQGLDVGPDGRVYVADTGNDRVQVFAQGGAFERTIGGPGSAIGQLEAPRAVAVDGDTLVVSDAGNGRLQRFELDDGFASASVPIDSPRGLAPRTRFGVLVASPSAGVRGLAAGLLATPSQLASPAPGEALLAPVDVVEGADGIYVADAGTSRIVVYTARLRFRRAIEGLPRPAVAVLPTFRREMESILVADGHHVAEIGFPIPSPVPAVTSLKERLAASDVEGALARIHPAVRSRYRRTYQAILPDLPLDAAGMEELLVDLVREERAVVRIRRHEARGADVVERHYPVHLVRGEDGSWLVVDY